MLKGIKVTLRDREYIIAPIPIDELEAVWPQVCMVLRETPGLSDQANFDKAPAIMKAAADVVFASMRLGNDPEMTREKVGRDVLDYGNWYTAFLAVLRVSNIQLTERDAGKAPALATASLSTGPQSEVTSPALSDGASNISAA